VIGPAISVVIKKPFTLEVANLPALTPGQSYSLQGKIQRHPLFKEAVQLKVDGLPTGVAAAMPSVPVAANQNEWKLELKVDAKAPPATTKLTLSATATINGMAYSTTPIPADLIIGKK
jgi:hypothetical protein